MEIKLSGGYTLDTKKKTQERRKGSHLKVLPSEFCIIDIETTGFDSQNDAIIELASLRIRNNKIVEEFSTLVNPHIQMPPFIISTTNITNEMVKMAPDLEIVLNAFLNFVGDDVLFGHNINFDINFIYDYCLQIYDKNFCNDYVDFLSIAKSKLTLNNYKLVTIADYLGVNSLGVHRALKDCKILFECYLRTCK